MNTRPLPDPSALNGLSLALLSGQNTLTLATARGAVPWAAPVYYVNRSFDCCFFSNPDSRHIQEARDNRHVAGTVFAPTTTWQAIKGLQMSGEIQPLGPGLQAAQAIAAYLEKYPFTSEFFSPGQLIDLAAFQRRFNVRLYRFRPEKAYYLDNSIAFGFRAKLLF